MATQKYLEDLNSIPYIDYSTGSEAIDGLLIGLATWLLIRNAEFVILDLLTFLFGDRKHRTAYRVLRIWEVLNLFHFYTLFTGFDSDIPRSHLPFSMVSKRAADVAPRRLNTSKGRFRFLLVISVLLGKLLVLGAEVAIIAFVIPDQTVHRSEGGLGFGWQNTTVTSDSISKLPVCQRLINSTRLADPAQLVICKRIFVAEAGTPVPPKWIPNGSLRLEEVTLTSENVAQFGASVDENDVVVCNGLKQEEQEEQGEQDEQDDQKEQGGKEEQGRNSVSARLQQDSSSSPSVTDEDFSGQWKNTLDNGEIAVLGFLAKAEEGFFMTGIAALLPLFSDTNTTLRLAFPEFWSAPKTRQKGITLNGKLLFGGPSEPGLGSLSNALCPEAIEEVMRVTGTLHPDLLIDVIRSGFTVFARNNFSQPSADVGGLQTIRGYNIGTSLRFRIQPEWMALAALIAVLLSAITSRLNNTKARMARVYREQNKMLSACSASFLEKESVVEGALFQNEDRFHWGSDPGWPWREVSFSELHENATLV